MNRRDFLKLQAAALAAAAVGGPSILLPPRILSAQTLPDVAVVKGAPAAATRRAVEAVGGMGRFVKPGQKVIVKPNMSFARGPEAAANTHPEVVREILIMCREARAGQVRVLDHSLQDAQKSLEQSGILAACDGVEKNICFHLMDDKFYLDTALADGVDMTAGACTPATAWTCPSPTSTPGSSPTWRSSTPPGS